MVSKSIAFDVINPATRIALPSASAWSSLTQWIFLSKDEWEGSLDQREPEASGFGGVRIGWEIFSVVQVSPRLLCVTREVAQTRTKCIEWLPSTVVWQKECGHG